MTTFSFSNSTLPAASSICQSFFESETCKIIQEQFSHFIGKVKQIDLNTFMYCAIPVTITAFSVYKSFPLLFGALRGYDSTKKREEFRIIATSGMNEKNQPIGLLQRASYLKKYAFGSISIKNRLYLTAKALSWLALATLAITPLFKKNINSNNVDIPSTIVDPRELQAAVDGKEKLKEFYLRGLADRERPILASDLGPDRIDPNIQKILQNALAPTETGPSLFEKVTEFFGYAEPTNYPLFTEIDGRTIVNGTVLEQQCKATLSQINQLVPTDFKQKLASGLGTSCNSTIGYFSSQFCNDIKDGLTPFQNTTTQGIAEQRLEAACSLLNHRASSDILYANFSPFLNGVAELLNSKKLIGQEQSASTSINANFVKSATLFNNGDSLKKLCSTEELVGKCHDLAKTLFNISIPIPATTDPKEIRGILRTFSAKLHPDQCRDPSLKKACDDVFQIGNNFMNLISDPQFNITTNSPIKSPVKPSDWYTFDELVRNFVQWYQTPAYSQQTQ